MPIAGVPLEPLQETLLMPLWARATFQHQYREFTDPFAEPILDELDFDTAPMDAGLGQAGVINLGYRAHRIDGLVAAFWRRHPTGTVLNLGGGLDTLYQRLAPQYGRVITVDLPDTIALRSKLIPPSPRDQVVAASLTDRDWWHTLPMDDPFFVVMAGVTMYLTRSDFTTLSRSLRKLPHRPELVFDALSPLGQRLGNHMMKSSRLPQVPFRLSFSGRDAVTKLAGSNVSVQLSPLLRGLDWRLLRPQTSAWSRGQLHLGRILGVERLFHVRWH